MCFEIPFNFSIGLIVPASLCVFGAFFAVYLYYLSRFKRRSSVGIKLFCFVCNLLFVINYFFNSGIFGPNLLLFSLGLLLIVTIIPKSQFKIWIPINLVSVFTIMVVEYYYPEVARNAYQSELSKAIDFGITYFVVVILTYFAISYIRKNYDMERNAVIAQNVAIEEQKAELERLNSEKDKLFSIVSHDIKLPLNSIQSYLEILTENDLDDLERQEVKKQLLSITRNTSDMLMNILSWSKSQMAGSGMQLATLDVGEALTKSLRIEHNLAAKKEITMQVEVAGKIAIIADPNMFQLVLRNLVGNAIKFTNSGGRIDVRATVKDDHCLISVQDTGLGIDDVQKDKLFKLKASSTYGTNNEKGIGLGLLLCKEFTELQGGTISFESTKGVGSTFLLCFKRASQETM